MHGWREQGNLTLLATISHDQLPLTWGLLVVLACCAARRRPLPCMDW